MFPVDRFLEKPVVGVPGYKGLGQYFCREKPEGASRKKRGVEFGINFIGPAFR